MRVQRRRPKSRIAGFFKGLLALVLVTGASLGLAYVWQNAQEGPPATANVAAQDDGTAEETQDPEQPVSGDSREEAQPTASAGGSGKWAIAGALPQSQRVDNSYFDDAIFFGDSISTGIPAYQVAGGPDTVAVRGLSPYNINTEAMVTTADGDSVMVLDAAKEYGEKNKVYIMLGSNGLWMDLGGFVQGYRNFIDAVKEQYPEAMIYLQTMPPVTTEAYIKYPESNNEKIREYNEAIATLAKTAGVYFVDVYDALADEDGNLPMEASPSDGVHLSPEYYEKWFDYLKTHTVEVS